MGDLSNVSLLNNIPFFCVNFDKKYGYYAPRVRGPRTNNSTGFPFGLENL